MSSNTASAAGSDKYDTPNAQKEYVVSKEQLPLHCPIKGSSLWNSHPQVYLDIEASDDGSAKCPYCGALYRLQEDE